MRRIVIFDIDYTLFDTDTFKESNLTKHFVYKEVKSVLEQLSKISILGILSEGDVVLQSSKLRNTDINNFFHKDHIHIVSDKTLSLKAFLDKYKNDKIALVDDRLPILYDAKKYMPSIFSVWVKRGRFAMSQHPIEGFAPDAQISDLSKIVSLINNSFSK